MRLRSGIAGLLSRLPEGGDELRIELAPQLLVRDDTACEPLDREASIGVRDAPSTIRSATTAPTPGASWKPWPQKPKACRSPGVVLLQPITGSMSGR